MLCALFSGQIADSVLAPAALGCQRYDRDASLRYALT